MERDRPPVQRCAVYTRKSSEEGLEQDFNSLHAQREACEAYIMSQAGEGWHLIKSAYDDGGISGGTLERPALQRLLADIQKSLIDVVLVYKIDRLTRSIGDFAKMVEIFDAHHVSFVSITQQFNTTTSMGRLTLNVLLSFAQFEREVTGERIRDKIAASKKKGMWMGGFCPLGYNIQGRQLVVSEDEAKLVRHIYQRYLELKSVRLLKQDLDRRGVVSKVRISRNGVRSGGRSFSRGALYQLLANPLYIGEVRHRKDRHPGLHQAIIDREIWDQVQVLLCKQSARVGRSKLRSPANFLAGKLFDENDAPLRSTGGNGRHGGQYHYYVSRELVTKGRSHIGPHRGWRLPARELEKSVITAALAILNDRAALAMMMQESGASTVEIHSVLEAAVDKIALLGLRSQAPLTLADLVTRVDLRSDGIVLSMSFESLLPPDSAIHAASCLRFSRFVPLKLKRRGFAMRLVIGGAVSNSKADATLLRAVARGHKWFNELLEGRAAFTREIAAREGVNERFVRRHIPLAFLAPTIVEAIVEGRQPVSLTAEAITRGIDIPLEWDKQGAALGFD